MAYWVAIFDLMVNGCTSLGSNAALKHVSSYSDARAQIRNGMSMDQVRKKWGSPATENTYNGQTTWNYAEGGIRRAKVVSIVFNSRGRVKNVRYHENKYSHRVFY